MGEVAKIEQMPVPVNESAAVLSMIERLACDPSSDMSKFEKLLDMQERVLNRNAKQAFMADLAAMQSELPRVSEKGKSNNGKYALLEDINDTVRPAMKKYGFAVSFRINQTDPKFVNVTGILAHKQGHSEETSMSLPVDTSGSKNATQSVGSTVSYGKRYVICALLNISTGDDSNGIPLEPGQSEPPKKQRITEKRLRDAITKINAGEYSVQRLNTTFELSAEQIALVQSECVIEGGAQ